MRSLWEQSRDAILAGWIRKRPGTRPTAWWLYDAPRGPGRNRAEPRLQLSGIGRSFGTDATGMPTGWYSADPAEPPTFESQAAYLDRHALLVPGERRRLRVADFAPVAVEVNAEAAARHARLAEAATCR